VLAVDPHDRLRGQDFSFGGGDMHRLSACMGKVFSEGLVLSALLLAWRGEALAASFDCAKAQSKMEKAVCADSALSGLDEKLATAYKSARAALSPDAVKALTGGQSSWLKFFSVACFVDREAKAASNADAVSCLSKAYETRIHQLSETGKAIGGFKSYVVINNAFRAFSESVASMQLAYVQLDDASPAAAALNRILAVGEGQKAAVTDEDEGTSTVATVSLQQVSPDILQISHFSEVDMGGVHPDEGIGYTYFSKRLNRELTLGDVFSSDEWKGAAKRISEQELNKRNVEPIYDVASVFDDKRLSDTFGFRMEGKDGFALERAFLSWAERGVDVVELPWSSFSNVLTPYAKEQIPQLREAQG
jgi:uncharacterized protein